MQNSGSNLALHDTFCGFMIQHKVSTCFSLTQVANIRTRTLFATASFTKSSPLEGLLRGRCAEMYLWTPFPVRSLQFGVVSIFLALPRAACGPGQPEISSQRKVITQSFHVMPSLNATMLNRIRRHSQSLCLRHKFVLKEVAEPPFDISQWTR